MRLLAASAAGGSYGVWYSRFHSAVCRQKWKHDRDLVHILDPRKMIVGTDGADQLKRPDKIMAALFDHLYREYCRARLAEMRKQLLISPKRHEAPEAICDARDIIGASPANHVDGGGDAPSDRSDTE